MQGLAPPRALQLTSLMGPAWTFSSFQDPGAAVWEKVEGPCARNRGRGRGLSAQVLEPGSWTRI